MSSTKASRRSFLSGAGLLLASAAAHAQEKKVDGGLARLVEKTAPTRSTRIVPAGAQSLRDFERHCTACQLCVSVCPNQVLRPSGSLVAGMQPEMSFERGFCRPECTRCSEACPAGAINRVSAPEKSSIQIGHAVWSSERCIVNSAGVNCSNCARHFPVGAIHMAPKDPDAPTSKKVPVVDAERCIGCGACEYHCPARPLSALHVEGHEKHRII